ncbi:unnamed protein product [Nippostrongylus brasiliensis]|uniref:BPTI/Kunitz inhibitor domain-containing protein n=1 Tax=Nippostrongylus brasiliensis TaxID=27835 RepID=A0A0N4Y6Y4_NIPBR|nr:unnamed protein product [Nippostrongylus brasiliensis]
MYWLLLLLPVVLSQKECTLGRDSGDACDQPSGQRFFFDMHTKRCQPFYFKSTVAVCKSGAYAAGATSLPKALTCSECPKGYECEDEKCCPKKEYLCNLQYDAGKFGDQGSHRPRYFYSKSFKNCMIFTFYGRDGNANNFETYNECRDMCMK